MVKTILRYGGVTDILGIFIKDETLKKKFKVVFLKFKK